MPDMERFTLSKVAMPKSGRGVLSAVIGGLLIVGPTKGCKLEPSWSNERKKMSLSAPLSAAITAPTFEDRKSTRLNSSHGYISYAVFCLKKKKKNSYTLQTTST